jgi:hypothetical protein
MNLTNLSPQVAFEKTLEAVLKQIDNAARTQLDFIQECGREGQWGTPTQHALVSSYNTLVCLRQKMTKAGLDAVEGFDNKGIEALQRVSVEQKPDGTPYLRFFE